VRRKWVAAVIVGPLVLVAASVLLWRHKHAVSQPPALQQTTKSVHADHQHQFDQILEASLAAGYPDKYAWKLFAKVNAKAGVSGTTCENVQPPRNGVTDDGTGDVCWQRWADADLDIFAKAKATSLAWPDHREMKFLPSFLNLLQVIAAEHAQGPPQSRQYGLLKQEEPGRYSEADFEAAEEYEQKLLPPAAPDWLKDPKLSRIPGEEIRLNKYAFDYVNQEQLWYQEGQKRALVCGITVNFPPESIAVKADWRVVGANDPPSFCTGDSPEYHCTYATNGVQWKLVALHIISRSLPDWVWATWEHKSNKNKKENFCHPNPCEDKFGYEYDANGNPSNQPSPELAKLLVPLGKEWENYRLHGTQISFTCPIGPTCPSGVTVLGNSVIEASFIKSSSCINCHSRAARKSNGSTPNANAYVGEPTNPDPLEDDERLGFLWSLGEDAVCRDPDPKGCKPASCPNASPSSP